MSRLERRRGRTRSVGDEAPDLVGARYKQGAHASVAGIKPGPLQCRCKFMNAG